MHIAFTHNLQLTACEEQAEFDTRATISAITEALERLGHRVEPVEVTGPVSRVVARLEALNPDLVFNTAEGDRGRFREGFYPAVFEQLGIPYTGSDAYVCTLTLDKHLTKLAVAGKDVPVPRWRFVECKQHLENLDLRYPLMVKPNYEGSSKGITQDSVVEDPERLQVVALDVLRRYPSGVLVEEFIQGRDVTVPFLEKARGQVLEPAQYDFDLEMAGNRRYNIYDYELKQVFSDAVQVTVPADITEAVRRKLFRYSRAVVRKLGIRDFGRLDYRVTPEGEVSFIEVNALPSLEPGASIYQSAREAGIDSLEGVLDAIVRSAARRYGLRLRPPKKRRNVRVGLAYNLKRKPEEDEAEFDSPDTVRAIREALESFGHEVVELEATPDFPTTVMASGVDLVFNMAEGMRGRTREAQVPALLELFDIPYTGSDPAALAMTLDKGLAKRLVRQAGLSTPDFILMETGRERVPQGFRFPAIVKPVAEGSSKGIKLANVIESDKELRQKVREVLDEYRQPVLVEEFLPGREFTIGLLGERRPRVLPPMEVLFHQPNTAYPVYSYEHKVSDNPQVRFEVPARVEPGLRKELERVARGSFYALGCRDIARIDLRLDKQGVVHFLECNPLPGLCPGFSDLVVIAEAAGIDFRTLVGDIMSPALRRFRAQKRRSRQITSEPASS